MAKTRRAAAADSVVADPPVADTAAGAPPITAQKPKPRPIKKGQKVARMSIGPNWKHYAKYFAAQITALGLSPGQASEILDTVVMVDPPRIALKAASCAKLAGTPLMGAGSAALAELNAAVKAVAKEDRKEAAKRQDEERVQVLEHRTRSAKAAAVTDEASPSKRARMDSFGDSERPVKISKADPTVSSVQIEGDLADAMDDEAPDKPVDEPSSESEVQSASDDEEEEEDDASSGGRRRRTGLKKGKGKARARSVDEDDQHVLMPEHMDGCEDEEMVGLGVLDIAPKRGGRKPSTKASADAPPITKTRARLDASEPVELSVTPVHKPGGKSKKPKSKVAASNVAFSVKEGDSGDEMPFVPAMCAPTTGPSARAPAASPSAQEQDNDSDRDTRDIFADILRRGANPQRIIEIFGQWDGSTGKIVPKSGDGFQPNLDVRLNVRSTPPTPVAYPRSDKKVVVSETPVVIKIEDSAEVGASARRKKPARRTTKKKASDGDSSDSLVETTPEEHAAAVAAAHARKAARKARKEAAAVDFVAKVRAYEQGQDIATRLVYSDAGKLLGIRQQTAFGNQIVLRETMNKTIYPFLFGRGNNAYPSQEEGVRICAQACRYAAEVKKQQAVLDHLNKPAVEGEPYFAADMGKICWLRRSTARTNVCKYPRDLAPNGYGLNLKPMTTGDAEPTVEQTARCRARMQARVASLMHNDKFIYQGAFKDGEDEYIVTASMMKFPFTNEVIVEVISRAFFNPNSPLYIPEEYFPIIVNDQGGPEKRCMRIETVAFVGMATRHAITEFKHGELRKEDFSEDTCTATYRRYVNMMKGWQETAPKLLTLYLEYIYKTAFNLANAVPAPITTSVAPEVDIDEARALLGLS